MTLQRLRQDVKRAERGKRQSAITRSTDAVSAQAKLRRVHPWSVALSILAVALGVSGLSYLSFGRAFAAAPANTAVPLYKNSQQLLGQYPHETILNKTNVNTASFGRVASYPVDGAIYAQPLFLPNISTASGTYNLIIVATEHDSVYAFDAGHTTTTPLWHTSFLINGATSVPSSVVYPGAFVDITPEVGITGTPVVDLASGSLYVSAMTFENGACVHRLHKLDITTGKEKVPPVVETATIPGTGDGSVNGSLTFRALTANQRPALLLLNGVVYVAFASFADEYPYHGWILGYNAGSLAQTTVFNTTPDGGGAGIWGTGGGLAVDPTDNSLFTADGNGEFNLDTGGASVGDSVMKLSATNGLRLTDYFTPFNQECLDLADKDLGSGGTLILPTQTGAAHPNVLVSVGKEGRVYLVDRTSLGKYVSVPDPCNNQSVTTYDKVVQEFPPDALSTGGIYSTPAYWNGVVYIASNGAAMKAFPLTNGLLATAPASQTPETFNFPGPNPVVSSNGNASATAIVWIISPPGTCPVPDHCNPSGGGALRAYDATNLGNELYSSTLNTARDGLASYVKFSVPTVANGQVFVGAAGSLDIFGLNPPPAPPTATPGGTATPSPTPTPPVTPYNNIGASNDSAPDSGNFDGSRSYSAQALASVGIVPGAAIPMNNAQFRWPVATAGTPNNYQAVGQKLPVTPIANAQTLAFLGAATNGAQSGTATITYTDGSTQTFTLAFSDWTLGGGGSSPIAGNLIAVKSPYRNTPGGKETVQTDVFYTDVALQPGKTIQSVSLPSQGGLHVFAVATTASPPAGQPAAPAYNNIGTSDDAAPASGNFDGLRSYSTQALQAAGVTPGATLTINGVQFTWPTTASGTPNNYQAVGQALPLQPAANVQAIAFLGAATYGAQSGTATIIYTDGTTQTVYASIQRLDPQRWWSDANRGQQRRDRHGLSQCANRPGGREDKCLLHERERTGGQDSAKRHTSLSGGIARLRCRREGVIPVQQHRHERRCGASQREFRRLAQLLGSGAGQYGRHAGSYTYRQWGAVHLAQRDRGDAEQLHGGGSDAFGDAGSQRANLGVLRGVYQWDPERDCDDHLQRWHDPDRHPGV